jgi:protein-L-isoaspartate(D-aspartate) O-methyltransferase
MNRRAFLTGGAALAAATMRMASATEANVPTPYRWELVPPMDTREHFITWGKAERGENAKFLGQRWDRFRALVRNRDLSDQKTMRAFLLTPREEFAPPNTRPHVYKPNFLDIGYGVTMSGPHLQARMTSVLDVKRGERVLEIGTGSGVQSAYLANLTETTYTIEIIKPLADRTRGIYDALISRGYVEYKHISSRAADGYYGWPEAAPFDKIIVTCGIDHVPPPLLSQLRSGGIMVIPVGPPGAQRVLRVVKQQTADGAVRVTREDIYGGKIVPFLPFNKLVDGQIQGAHNK